MANVLCDLYHLTGEAQYKDKFETLVKVFGSTDPNEIFGSAGLCSAVLRFEKMETIAIVGSKDDQSTKTLINKASRYPSPNRKLLLGDGKTTPESPHMMAGKLMIKNKPTAYVCQVGTCSPAITSPDELEEALSELPL